MSPMTLPASLTTPATLPRDAVHVLGVAQHDLATGSELDERPLVRVPGTLPVLDGDDEPLPEAAAAHEHAVHALDFECRVSTDELELPICAQDSGQEARLAQDLEPVADAQHRASARCEGADGVHDRSDAGDRARAQVVAVGEASRQDDCP